MRWPLALVIAVGCNAPRSDVGELDAHCYPNGTCNATLTCVGGVCLAIDAAVPDAAVPDAAVLDAAVPDAAIPDAMCTIDDLAANDSIANATQTMVAQNAASKTYSDLTICPDHDKDYFAVSIVTANQNLEMLATKPGSGTIQTSILNSAGVPIANGVPFNGMTEYRAYTPNLPTGTYYGVVYAGTGTTSAYQVTFTVSGP